MKVCANYKKNEDGSYTVFTESAIFEIARPNLDGSRSWSVREIGDRTAQGFILTPERLAELRERIAPDKFGLFEFDLGDGFARIPDFKPGEIEI